MTKPLGIGTQRVSLALSLVMLVVFSGCNKNNAITSSTAAPVITPTPKVTGPAAAVATTTYEAEGTVISMKPKVPSIEIDHQDIKDLMPAMKMEFYVKDKALLEGLKAGDPITFTLTYGVGGLMITRITKKG